MNDIDNLKVKFADASWSELMVISDELTRIGGKEVVAFLIEQLTSDRSECRNAAALGLRDIGHDKATKFLIKGILHPIDPNQCGTLAYALEQHDCSMELVHIFKILFYANYECKLHAHHILSEQEFVFTHEDLLKVQQMWNECLRNPIQYPQFETLKDQIQEDVNDFLAYLEE